MRRIVVPVLASAVLGVLAAARPAAAVTDDDVLRAIERGKNYLLKQQRPDGTWPEKVYDGTKVPCGHTEIAFFTLAYLGLPPDQPPLGKTLDAEIARQLDYNYAISFRAMGLAAVQNKLRGAKRDVVRAALMRDVKWLLTAQRKKGGWTYNLSRDNEEEYDLSNTQMSILGLREAALAGIEIPTAAWQRAQALYFQRQQADGSWNYGEEPGKNSGNAPGYGSMTAASIASLFIIRDNLDPGSGCPCRSGQSGRAGGESERRLDAALKWLEANFSTKGNPRSQEKGSGIDPYWLYAAERVGIASGCKYFGTHDWYREGAASIVKDQDDNGSWWDELSDTCFCLLFLHKGRGPILFNKLQFGGEWNAHRRDIANLTAFIEKAKEQQFHWQIVNLRVPVEELHDAPILYVTAETPPALTAEDRQKLRRFTDTGGTILFEASCGNMAVRRWFQDFAANTWPEWKLKALGPDHPTFADPYPLRPHPAVQAIDDGLRTFLFYAPDDVSCAWQTRAHVAKEYLFKWGINLFTCATDHVPLRAKLAGPEPPTSGRYASPVKGGPKEAVHLARLKYAGTWFTGRNYGCLDRVAAALAEKVRANVLKVEEQGVDAADLGDREAAYLVGAAEVDLAEPDRLALKQYLARGGFVWLEAAGGSRAFDQALRKLADGLSWQLKPLPMDHPLMTGKFGRAAGYNLTSGVQFSRALHVSRLNRPFAELVGVYQDDRLVGIYSPIDVLFSTTGYAACGRLGYQQDDAFAVAANIILYLTDPPARGQR